MKEQEENRKSLRHSIMDGAFYASMMGFGESFLVAYAVLLGANNVQIGMLSSLPQALGSLSQILANTLRRLFSTRKRYVFVIAVLQASVFVPVALVYFFGRFSVWNLIALVCVYWVLGLLANPVWSGWIGDITEERERATFFGRRNSINGLSTFVTFLAAGYILQRFDAAGSARLGFTVIFLLAFASRLLSAYHVLRMHEPPEQPAEEHGPGMLDFINKARGGDFGVLVLYLSLMSFSVHISVPFFTPFMLKDLSMDYMTYTCLIAVAIIAKVYSMGVWGRMADSYGPRKVLTLSGLIMPIVPLFWVLSHNIFWLAAVQVYSGFVWAGYEVSGFSFLFDSTNQRNRSSFIAYYNLLNGLCIFAGAIVGGFIVRHNEAFWSSYLLVFLISTLARYAVSLVFLPRLREVRIFEPITYPGLLLRTMTIMPTRGLVFMLIPFEGMRRLRRPR